MVHGIQTDQNPALPSGDMTRASAGRPRSPGGWHALLLLLALAAVFARPGVAAAHAIVVRSEPPDGAVLAEPPTQVRLWFSEPIALSFTAVELSDGSGRRLPILAARTTARDLALAIRVAAPAAPSEVTVDLPPLAPGAYRLSWRTISNGDLHATSGAVVFGVRHVVDLAATAEPWPAPTAVLLRWLLFGAEAALAGALLVALWLLPAAGGDPPLAWHLARRTLQIAPWAAALALLAGAALAVVPVATSDPAATLARAAALLGGSDYGTRWLLSAGLLIGLAALAGFSIQKPAGRRGPALVAAALLLAYALVQAFNGHAAAFPEVVPARIAAAALHHLAASVWVGGAILLAVIAVPLLCRPETASLGRGMLRQFGLIAVVCVATLASSGLYAAGQQVATLDALLVSGYGQALIAKIALAGAVALLGLVNAALLHPGLAGALAHIPRFGRRLPCDPAHLRRFVRAEALAGGALLLLTALLTATPPARGPAFDAPAPAPPPQAVRADDLFLTLEIKPAQPGPNFITIGVFDTRRPPPAPVGQVELRLASPGAPAAPLTLAAAPIGGGHYQASGEQIDVAGRWQIAIVVHRPGLPDASATLPWTIAPPAARRAVLLSNRPLAPALTAAAGAFALLCAGAFARFRFRRTALPFRQSARHVPKEEL